MINGFHVIMAGDHDNGDRGIERVVAQFLANIEAVFAGHGDIQEDQIRPNNIQQSQSLIAVFGFLDGEACTAQCFAEQATNSRIIVGNNDN